MEEKLVRSTFYRFLWPTLAGSVTLSVLSMTDLVIAGHVVGEAGLETISLSLPVIMLVQILASLFGTGGGIIFAEQLGKSDFDSCSRVLSMSVIFSLLCGMVLGAAGLAFLRPVLLFLGSSESGLAGAGAYMKWLFAGLPFLILSPVLVTYLRNDSCERFSMFCVLFCAVLNAALSLFAGGFLGLGLSGIGMGTVVSEAVCCLFAGMKLYRRKRSYGIRRDFFSGVLFLSMVKTGGSVAVIFLCQAGLTVFVNRILSTEGDMAVYAVVKQLINFLFAFFDGVSGSVQPMLGIYYGEREKDNIRCSARIALRTMASMAALVFLLLETGGHVICRIFGITSASVLELAVPAIRIVGFYAFAAACITFLNVFYRCLGNARISYILGLADNLIFPILSISFFVFGLGSGSIGVFAGIFTSACLTLVLWMFLARPIRKSDGRWHPASAEELFLSGTDFPDDSRSFREIAEIRPDSVRDVMERVEAYCEGMDISMKKQFYINLCMEELILNVVGLAEEKNRASGGSRTYAADIVIRPQEDGSVYLRIRDNLTEWTPDEAKTDISGADDISEDVEGLNDLGLSIIRKVAVKYSYKQTVGFNNFSVIL